MFTYCSKQLTFISITIGIDVQCFKSKVHQLNGDYYTILKCLHLVIMDRLSISHEIHVGLDRQYQIIANVRVGDVLEKPGGTGQSVICVRRKKRAINKDLCLICLICLLFITQRDFMENKEIFSLNLKQEANSIFSLNFEGLFLVN